MPSLFDPDYQTLIRNIPTHRHAVKINAQTWQPKFAAAGILPLWTAIFGAADEISITRQRILQHPYPNREQRCAEILLWGYPSDSRGLVSRILPHLTGVSTHAETAAPWATYYHHLHVTGGLGISTISKLAWGFGHRFNHHPALILDSRVIQASMGWDETHGMGLTYAKASHSYPDYLHCISACAGRMHCAPEQIEFFLFTMGEAFA